MIHPFGILKSDVLLAVLCGYYFLKFNLESTILHSKNHLKNCNIRSLTEFSWYCAVSGTTSDRHSGNGGSELGALIMAILLWSPWESSIELPSGSILKNNDVNKPSNTDNSYWVVIILYPMNYNKLTIFLKGSDCCRSWPSHSWVTMAPLLEILFH